MCHHLELTPCFRFTLGPTAALSKESGSKTSAPTECVPLALPHEQNANARFDRHVEAHAQPAGVITHTLTVVPTAASGGAAKNTAEVHQHSSSITPPSHGVDDHALPGTRTWSDGSLYEGEWRDDARHGRGVCVYAVDGCCEGGCQCECLRVSASSSADDAHTLITVTRPTHAVDVTRRVKSDALPHRLLLECR